MSFGDVLMRVEVVTAVFLLDVLLNKLPPVPLSLLDVCWHITNPKLHCHAYKQENVLQENNKHKEFQEVPPCMQFKYFIFKLQMITSMYMFFFNI